MSKERSEEMKDKYLKAIPFETINGINVIAVDKKDLDYFIEQAELHQKQMEYNSKAIDIINALEVRFNKMERQNKRYRETLSSSLSEIKHALYSSKSKDVKEHYLQNAERFITEALESESNE